MCVVGLETKSDFLEPQQTTHNSSLFLRKTKEERKNKRAICSVAVVVVVVVRRASSPLESGSLEFQSGACFFSLPFSFRGGCEQKVVIVFRV